jgi:hypothetical protein
VFGQSFELTVGTAYSDTAVEAVPEPSTYALLAISAAGLVGFVLRRHAQVFAAGEKFDQIGLGHGLVRAVSSFPCFPCLCERSRICALAVTFGFRA